MRNEAFLAFLLWITIINVATSVVMVVWNAASPLSLRFNLAFLVGTCVLGIVNCSIYYGWI